MIAKVNSASDMIKMAMIRIYEKLSRLIMQVHDELVLEAPVDSDK